VTVLDDTAAEGAEFAEDYLEHFGVKGMKWGVRRASEPGFAVSDDARKAARAAGVAKKQGTKVLSNEDLQRLVTRMNLEQQYNKLKPPTPSKKATKFVAEFLLGVGKQQAAKFANDQLGKVIAKKLAGA
jgi:hypothetical protein